MRKTNFWPGAVFVTICFPLLLAIYKSDSASGAGSLTSPSFPQKFTVNGNKIVSAQGVETVFRGLIPQDPVWQALCDDPDLMPWQEAQFQAMSEWGAKIVRLSVTPASWRQYGQAQSFVVMDQFIAWAGQYGMYVYVDFHSIGFPPTEQYQSETDDCFEAFGGQVYQTTQSEIEDFWLAVATRYKDNKVVALYELFNEPDRNSSAGNLDDWLLWRDYVETLIDTIRGIDPDKPVIVGGLQFAYDLSFASANPVRRGNVIYAIHPYPDADWNISWDDAFGNLTATYPVFATEFGFQNNPPNKPENGCTRCTGVYREEIISFLEAKNISWTVWSFSDTWPPALLSDKSYTPSESGAFFKAKLLEKALPVSVGSHDESLPGGYRLAQNYPNPFNAGTTLRYALPKPGHVTLKIYNSIGYEVETLVSRKQQAGEYSVRWDAKNVSSGVYTYRLQVRGVFVETKKLVLLK